MKLKYFLRKFRYNPKKSFLFLFLFLFLVSFTIGYAFLTKTLSIEGSSTLVGATWDIHFDNLVVTTGSVTATTEATITTPTSVTFSAQLENPGDFYEFNVDVVNDGTFNAMIDSYSFLPVLTAEQQEYLEYTVTYSDGVPLAVYQKLDAGTQETLRIRFGYIDGVDASLYPLTDQELTIEVEIVYVQADENAIIRPVSVYEIMKNNAVMDNINSTYVSNATPGIKWDEIASDTNGKGIYLRAGTENDAFPIYYYRGAVDNNNVYFGGFCWKIVRTTATGGIRMIYNGVVNNDNSCGTAPGNTTERTHTQNHIKMTRGALNGDNYTSTQGTGQSTFQYNIPYRGYKYVGYMYETTEENDTDSNFKRVLDAWYSAYLTSYDNKIEDSIYCNDRTYTTINNQEYYCPRTRAQNSIPSTLCSRKTDAFGVNNGNKKSTYKVGFITVDEEMLAGRSWNYGMKDYLYSSNNYWTGSPMVSSSTININERKAFVFYIVFDSYLNYSYYLDVDIANAGVRPVISLKVNTSYTGTGSLTDPFIVN